MDSTTFRRASGSVDDVHPIEVCATGVESVTLRLGVHHGGMTAWRTEWEAFVAAVKAGEFDDLWAD